MYKVESLVVTSLLHYGMEARRWLDKLLTLHWERGFEKENFIDIHLEGAE